MLQSVVGGGARRIKRGALLLVTMGVLGVVSAAMLDEVGLGDFLFDMGVLAVEIKLLSGMGLF